MLKTIINAVKFLKIVREQPGMVEVVKRIFDFVDRTHKEGKPMACEIAVVNKGDGSKMGDFVSLWAGIGGASAIERAKQLKHQNDELRRVLQLYRDGKITAENHAEIDLILKIFG